jgi:hypothetical protein
MGATPTGVRLWLGGIVPYKINANLGNIVAIKDAIKTLRQQTNVRLPADTVRCARTAEACRGTRGEALRVFGPHCGSREELSEPGITARDACPCASAEEGTGPHRTKMV